MKKIKLDNIKNRYDVVNGIVSFSNNNPITSESIMEYMYYWDKEFEHFKVDICEFVQLCCFLKCYSQSDDEKICSATHRLYKIAGYNSPVGIMQMLYDKCLVIRNSGQSEERIAIEICTAYQNIFGVRYMWIGAVIENDFSNWNKYRVIKFVEFGDSESYMPKIEEIRDFIERYELCKYKTDQLIMGWRDEKMLSREQFITNIFNAFKNQYGENVKATFEINYNSLELTVEEKNREVRRYIFPKFKVNEFNIGDKFRIKELRKVQTSCLDVITDTIQTNCVGVIKSKFENDDTKQYELFVDDIGSIFVDDKYLMKQEKICKGDEYC